ncbi:hypothetical protein AcW1_002672 [Taiwanofungus camphoratus]|nr:hypothetical protein AcW1_002672 [Antrodia cinnamomea]
MQDRFQSTVDDIYDGFSRFQDAPVSRYLISYGNLYGFRYNMAIRDADAIVHIASFSCASCPPALLLIKYVCKSSHMASSEAV